MLTLENAILFFIVLALLLLLVYFIRVLFRTLINPYPPIEKIDKMEGQEFEAFCRNLLSPQYDKVMDVGEGPDFGLDLLATKGNKRIAIQCKRYKSAVGVAAIQQIVAALAFHNCSEAVVITNSTFTRPAIKLAKANNVLLLDRSYIIKKLKQKQWI